MATIVETGVDVPNRSLTIYEEGNGTVRVTAMVGVVRSDGRIEPERSADTPLSAAVTAGILTAAQATAYKSLSLALYNWLKTQAVPT